jgi:hypothetical protein
MLLKTTLKQQRRENTWIWKRGLDYPVSDRRGEAELTQYMRRVERT